MAGFHSLPDIRDESPFPDSAVFPCLLPGWSFFPSDRLSISSDAPSGADTLSGIASVASPSTIVSADGILCFIDSSVAVSAKFCSTVPSPFSSVTSCPIPSAACCAVSVIFCNSSAASSGATPSLSASSSSSFPAVSRKDCQVSYSEASVTNARESSTPVTSTNNAVMLAGCSSSAEDNPKSSMALSRSSFVISSDSCKAFVTLETAFDRSCSDTASEALFSAALSFRPDETVFVSPEDFILSFAVFTFSLFPVFSAASGLPFSTAFLRLPANCSSAL